MSLRLEPVSSESAPVQPPALAAPEPLSSDLAEEFWSAYPPLQAGAEHRPAPYDLAGPALIHRAHYSPSQFGPRPREEVVSETLTPCSGQAPAIPAQETARLVLAWPYQLPAQQTYDERGNYAPLDGCVSPVRVFFRFSAPAAALGSSSTPDWHWQPAVAGDWEWIDPLTLAFCADQEFEREQLYLLQAGDSVVRLRRGEAALEFSVEA